MLRRLSLAFLMTLGLSAPALAVPVGTSADTRPAAPQQRQQWKEGGLGLKIGGSFLQGNVNLSTLSTAFTANYNLGAHQLFLDAGNFYSGTPTQILVNRVAGSTLYAYAIADNQNVFAYTTHSHDRSIKLDYRLTSGLGWCWHKLFPETFSLFLVSANPAVEYELFEANAPITTLRGVFRLNVIKPVTEMMEAGFDGFLTPAVQDPGDTRLYGEAYLRIKLLGDNLALKLTVADEYDSRPLAGVQPNDLGVFTELEAGWGR